MSVTRYRFGTKATRTRTITIMFMSVFCSTMLCVVLLCHAHVHSFGIVYFREIIVESSRIGSEKNPDKEV